MSTLPVRRSARVRSGTQRVPALTPDDSDYDPFDAESPPSPHSSHQPKKTKRTRKATMSRASSGPSPPFGDGSSHRGKNVVRHDQLRRHAACASCRRRRTKCDAVKPVCGACVRHRNYLRRSSKGAAVEMGDDCGCVYEGDDGDSGTRRGSKAWSTEYANDVEAAGESSLPSRSERDLGESGVLGGSASPSLIRKSSQTSGSEVIFTPALELSEEAVAQMCMGGGGSGASGESWGQSPPSSMEVIDPTTCAYAPSAYPSLPSQAPVPKPDRMSSLPYPTAYYPLQSLPALPVHSAPLAIPQSLDHSGVYLPDDSLYSLPFHPQPNPWQGDQSTSTPPALARLDTFPPNPSAQWSPTWAADGAFPSDLFLSTSAPDFSLSSNAPGMGERSYSSHAQSIAQQSSAPSRDDSTPFQYGLSEISYDGANSYPTFDLPQAGKADGNDSGLAAAQRGWIPGSLGFGGAPGEGWAQGSFEERMAAAGTAPGPLSPDQLFAMMQLLGNQVGPMV